MAPLIAIHWRAQYSGSSFLRIITYPSGLTCLPLLAVSKARRHHSLHYTNRTRRVTESCYRAEARRIANLHWFAHARVELKTTYAAPDINIILKSFRVHLAHRKSAVTPLFYLSRSQTLTCSLPHKRGSDI